MEIAIKRLSVIHSTHGGEVFRLDGVYVNELNELAPCKTFIDPKNRNWDSWAELIDTMAQNPQVMVIVNGVKFKRRAKGLLDADSRPIIVSVETRPGRQTA